MKWKLKSSGKHRARPEARSRQAALWPREMVASLAAARSLGRSASPTASSRAVCPASSHAKIRRQRRPAQTKKAGQLRARSGKLRFQLRPRIHWGGAGGGDGQLDGNAVIPPGRKVGGKLTARPGALAGGSPRAWW